MNQNIVQQINILKALILNQREEEILKVHVESTLNTYAYSYQLIGNLLATVENSIEFCDAAGCSTLA